MEKGTSAVQEIRIGTRESRLAVAQAEILAEYIRCFCSGKNPRLVTMKTAGDRILDRTLENVGGKGLFVKELELSLRAKSCDIAVHSLKDMPMEIAEDLPVVGVSPREDARDVLVLPEGKTELDASLPLGTSSPRRIIQLRKLFPGMKVKSVRGNVLTRLAKLDNGEYIGLVLAAAGMKRLGLAGRISRYFTAEEILPAAGQGVLAVQGRQGEDYRYLDGFFDSDTAFLMLAERSFVLALNGGCSSPIAAYAKMAPGNGSAVPGKGAEADMLKLTGLYAKEGSDEYKVASVVGEKEKAEALGRELARLVL